MARDESDDEEEGENFHNTFKKLKIDPDRKKEEEEESSYVDINSIWLGQPSTSQLKEKNPSPKRPKHRVSPSRRAEPYPDWGLSFERLCLRKEKCNKKLCLCKSEKNKQTSAASDQNLNFALGGPRKLIQDARLKLHHHHAQKDHRQIIRAAKLQLNEAKRSKVEKSKARKGSVKNDFQSSTEDTVFGSGSAFNSTNFANFESKSANEFPDSKDPDRFFFSGHRTSQPSTGLTGASNKPSSSSDNSPNKVEKSCSQEATVEDLSVNELAGYFEDFVHIPKKMSVMAEMMYT